MREGLITAVKNVVAEELEEANESFPLFNSNHEGYAVIAEELEEVQAENQAMIQAINVLWEDVKRNRKTTDIGEALQNVAVKLACEAIQVAAMAEKYNTSMEQRGEVEEVCKQE